MNNDCRGGGSPKDRYMNTEGMKNLVSAITEQAVDDLLHVVNGRRPMTSNGCYSTITPAEIKRFLRSDYYNMMADVTGMDGEKLVELVYENKRIEDWLQKFYDEYEELECMKRKLGYLKDKVSGLSSPPLGERVQTSISTPDRMAETLCEINELEKVLLEKADKRAREERILKNLIENLSDERYKIVILERYINAKGWKEVAEEVPKRINEVYRYDKKGISVQYAHRLKIKAVKELHYMGLLKKLDLCL